MNNAMPDIACLPNQGPQGKLNWVGMSGIEQPILIYNNQHHTLQVSSKVQAYVSLDDTESKGIHMSRLYLILDQMGAEQPLTPKRIKAILDQFIASHIKLSQNAMVEFAFDYYERRKSLKSENTGWKNYPVKLRGEIRNGQFQCELSITVPYSSTCPCSAALARQLIQEGFKAQFNPNDALDYQAVINWLGTPEGISATPHSQRSYAQVKITLDAQHELSISSIINEIEASLKTAVQATVKREDEQEFARLNASNLMFCEDAARRIQATFNQQPKFLDYWVRINHLESLHPHDAVAIITKGIENGYQDDPNLMDPL